MYRVTTPKHTFSLPEDSSGYLKIEVTYRQANKDKVYKLVKLCEDGVCSPGMTLDGKDVIIELSQEETKKFAPGKSISAQLKAKDLNGKVAASPIFKIGVNDVLSEDIL